MNKLVLTGALLLSLLIGGCGNGGVQEETAIRKEPYEKTEFLMGTYVTVRVYDEVKRRCWKKLSLMSRNWPTRLQ